MRRAFLLLAVTLLFAACRVRESMASRSAKAYDEAIRTATPIGGDGHGSPAAAPTVIDHAAMGHAVAAQPADHAAMRHAVPGERADHAAMGHAAAERPAEHAAMAHAPQTTAAPMDHASMGHAAAPAPTRAGQRTFPISEAPASSGAMAQLRPSSTLSTDAQDAPAPSAVSEANKAAAAASGAHAGHGEQQRPPGSGR